MRFDMRAALRGALDVPVPPLDIDALRARGKQKLVERARRGANTISALGLLVACMALAAATSSAGIAHADVAMQFAAPAPEPVST